MALDPASATYSAGSTATAKLVKNSEAEVAGVTWSITAEDGTETALANIDSAGKIAFSQEIDQTTTFKVTTTYNGKTYETILTANNSSNSWRATMVPHKNTYHVGEVIQAEITDGTNVFKTSEVGWAFTVTATGGNVNFNTNNNGITLNSAGTITLNIKTNSNAGVGSWLGNVQLAEPLPEASVTINVTE